MKKQTNEIEGQECPSERARAQLHRALRLLSGKWKGEILWQLVDGKQRFGQLRRAIPDVTQHMLTTQLRDLESEGLVKRIWQWKDQYEERILRQLREIGASCDWARTRFTLDPMLSAYTTGDHEVVARTLLSSNDFRKLRLLDGRRLEALASY